MPSEHKVTIVHALPLACFDICTLPHPPAEKLTAVQGMGESSKPYFDTTIAHDSLLPHLCRSIGNPLHEIIDSITTAVLRVDV
jgi:hypothetical protein